MGPTLHHQSAQPPPSRAQPGPKDLALVLSGGGARAAYQAGVLSAIAEMCPGLSFPIITGVSAGAINAAYLAASAGPLSEAARELRRGWEGLTADRVYRLRPTRLALSTAGRLIGALFGRNSGPAQLPGLCDLDPLRNYLGGAVSFRGIAENITAGRLRALALSATPYAAATHTFVHGVPDIPMWERADRLSVRTSITVDHVVASAAIPLIFPAIWLDGAFYGDGSVRQTAPLAPAIHLGASRILVIGTRHGPSATAPRPTRPLHPTVAEGMGLLFDAIFLDALDADAERLTRLNDVIASIPPEIPVPYGLRPVRFLHLKPSRELSTFVTGQNPRLPWAMRLGVRAMGGEAVGSRVLLSYLLFDPSFTGKLITLGFEDAKAQASRIEQFMAD